MTGYVSPCCARPALPPAVYPDHRRHCGRCNGYFAPAAALTDVRPCPGCGTLAFMGGNPGTCAACHAQAHEPQGEKVRLFEPAPAQFPGQTSLGDFS